MSAGRDRVAAEAVRLGLDIEFVHRPAARSLEEAAALLGLEVGSVVKSLVVKRHDGDFLFALVPGGRRISWAKLRRVVGVNKLQLPPPELALDVTGFERGTITPLGSSTPWPIYADSTIVGKRIALGAGEQGWSVLVAADAAILALSATVADLTDPESGPAPAA